MAITREKPVDIVLDCDDILWPFVERIARKLGIDISIWDNFYLSSNLHWSPDLLAKGTELLHDPRVFDNIQFDTGIKDILRPEELGARVFINSQSVSQEILESKKEQLLATVPGLKPKQLHFTLIKANTFSEKALSPQTLIFCDDNPHQITKSTAQINVMRKWPWNTSSSAKQLLANKKHVVKLPDLETINRYIYHRTKAFLCHGA